MAEQSREAAEQDSRSKLRRRLFGYKRSDVEGALGISARELTELRQDMAALWLAFARQDRLVRETLARLADPPQADRGEPQDTSGEADAPDPEAAPGAEPEVLESSTAGSVERSEDGSSIGEQLSELDEVLATIEKATQTLERTYAEEIESSEHPGERDPREAPVRPEATG